MSDENLSSVEQCINDIAECPICNEVLQDNRCLPCLHMFCLKCLTTYRRGTPKGKPLPCPVCRREFYIPKSVAELPRNFFIDKLLDAKTIKKEDVLPKPCEICSENKGATVKSRFTINNASDYLDVARASRFCCDCCQYMCLSCEVQHKKIKATTWHKIIDSGSVTQSQELATRTTYCTTHKTKEAEVYCRDCKMVICWQCKAQSHSNHDSVDVSNATKDLAAKLEEQIEQISKHLQKKHIHIRKLDEDHKSYTDKIDAESETICREQRKLTTAIAVNGDRLRKSLTTSTEIHLNAFGELRDKLTSEVDELNKHKVYIEQMIHLGNVGDLCEYTDELALKTNRLTEEHVCRVIVPPVAHLLEADVQDLLIGKRTDIDLQYRNLHTGDADIGNDDIIYLKDDLPTTAESKWILKDIENKSTDSTSQLHDQQPPPKESESVVKDIEDRSTDSKSQLHNLQPPTKQSKVKDIADKINHSNSQLHSHQPPAKQSKAVVIDEDSSIYKDLSLMRTIPQEQNRSVCGITVFDSMLYVISQDSNMISVYSEVDLVLINKLTIDGLVNPNDIVSCTFNNCLFICDWGRAARIFRVKARVGMEQINWSTDGDFGCLSVTTDHTILLAGYISSTLKEYTPDGELIRSIYLGHDIKPWHAIKLNCNNKHFLICQGDNIHRVCLIDLNGKVIKTFGGVKGSDEKHLWGPYHLAVDNCGRILVSDCNNSRVLLISQELELIKEIIPSSARVLRRARRMHLDQGTGRLYLADNAKIDSVTMDGRILVFQHLLT